MKIHIIRDGLVAFRCPGCRHAHAVEIPRWTWNGDHDAPTFQPSINCHHPADAENGIPEYRCHSVVTDGFVSFCADSTHALRGQRAPIPEW